MTTPIPNCPQPETPIRDRAWTDEQIEAKCAEALRKYRADCPDAKIDGADFDAGFFAAFETIGATP